MTSSPLESARTDPPASGRVPSSAEFAEVCEQHLGQVWRQLRAMGVTESLLDDATQAIVSLGVPVGDHLIAVENTPARHNMVVCTLCSCYPWDVLGLPPVWYKSAPYRARAVMDPRGVLADFGLTLTAETEIRVWDSTAETRFLVLPQRPSNTEGWSEERLATLVTRDCMIGMGLPLPPAGAPA